MSLFPEDSRLPTLFLQPRPPTAYETLLGDALEAAFGDGATELEQVVARLNADGIRTPQGGSWTVENFEPILKSL